MNRPWVRRPSCGSIGFTISPPHHGALPPPSSAQLEEEEEAEEGRGGGGGGGGGGAVPARRTARLATGTKVSPPQDGGEAGSVEGVCWVYRVDQAIVVC